VSGRAGIAGTDGGAGSGEAASADGARSASRSRRARGRTGQKAQVTDSAGGGAEPDGGAEAGVREAIDLAPGEFSANSA
jgi:hypothetical protein